ncbi:MAG: response regulator [Coleofasciculaceae cyanobacterium RL_1_1]|nr:response regulator [Coleofasciculaceae cyanobacterium RL_1_1]
MGTVLVVEDGQTDRERINRFLKKAGHTVANVGSRDEAFTYLKSQKPDLIVLDVILPGQSGFEICRELKGSDTTKAIPVMICSSKGTDVDKTWGNMLGADAYLTKPVDESELTTTLKQLLG